MTYGNIDIEKLKSARRYLQDLKDTKLAFRTHKHIGDSFSFVDLANHFQEECSEFQESLISGSLKENIEEIVDLSNMLDLFMLKILEMTFLKD